MVKVNVEKQSSYPISTPKIKRAIKAFLKKRGVVSDSQVDVALVGEKKMRDLGKKYLKEKGNIVHNVLAFPAYEVKKEFVDPPDAMRLGEIVVCFPKAREEAKEEGKLIDEKVLELIEHGSLHLLGFHHK